MSQAIDRVATGLGDGIGTLASTGLLFVVFALLWAAFGVAIVLSQGSLDSAWAWVRGLPLVLQGLAWLLLLPIMAALWVWQSSWPLAVRATLVVGLAVWNLLVFPKPWQ
jgi:hypothetical protein